MFTHLVFSFGLYARRKEAFVCAAKRKAKGTKEANVITVTPRGTVVAFGCLQRRWRGMKFERRSRLSRTARAMIADAKAKERASRGQDHRGS